MPHTCQARGRQRVLNFGAPRSGSVTLNPTATLIDRGAGEGPNRCRGGTERLSSPQEDRLGQGPH